MEPENPTSKSYLDIQWSGSTHIEVEIGGLASISSLVDNTKVPRAPKCGATLFKLIRL